MNSEGRVPTVLLPAIAAARGRTRASPGPATHQGRKVSVCASSTHLRLTGLRSSPSNAGKDVDQIGPCGARPDVRTFGLPVLRIRPGSAEPNVHRGVHSATTDEHEIRRLFSSGPESKAARTGRGWLVVDLTGRMGSTARPSCWSLMQDRGRRAPVPWATTPSGGRHGRRHGGGETQLVQLVAVPPRCGRPGKAVITRCCRPRPS